MNCDMKTMLKVAAGLGIALAVAYFALPSAQAFVLANAAILVALICPIAMIFMMLGMRGNKKDESAKPDENKVKSEIREAGPDKA